MNQNELVHSKCAGNFTFYVNLLNTNFIRIFKHSAVVCVCHFLFFVQMTLVFVVILLLGKAAISKTSKKKDQRDDDERRLRAKLCFCFFYVTVTS